MMIKKIIKMTLRIMLTVNMKFNFMHKRLSNNAMLAGVKYRVT